MASAYYALMRGGGEHYTYYISKSLSKLGCDVTILCGRQPFFDPKPISNELKINYVPQLFFLRELGMKEIKILSAIPYTLHYYQYLVACYISLVNFHEFDIIHAHDPASLRAAISIKKKYQIPIVCSYHGVPGIKQINQAKEVDAIIPVNTEIGNIFFKNGFKNVFIFPAGVDLSIFKPENKDECKKAIGIEGTIILFVGRLIPTKNLFNLFRAFRMILTCIPNAKLLIVGEGPLKEGLIKFAELIQIRNNISFVGAIEFNKLSKFYNSADCFVLPSKYESFSLVALEAAACGLPLVISRGADTFIKIFGEDSLFIVDPNDVNSIYTGIIASLVQDTNIDKGIRNLNTVRNFDWNERIYQIKSIYDSLIK
jgi:glycosyltransferase involved in cell wall biosynthesis